MFTLISTPIVPVFSILFLKNGPFSASFTLFSSFQYSWQYKVNINFANDWIWTVDFWCRKRLLYQLRHNHCSFSQYLISLKLGLFVHIFCLFECYSSQINVKNDQSSIWGLDSNSHPLELQSCNNHPPALKTSIFTLASSAVVCDRPKPTNLSLCYYEGLWMDHFSRKK